MKNTKLSLVYIFCLVSTIVFGQVKDPSPFDFGKMWTFENPPKEWFKEAYNFTPEDEWFDDVRKSSLRFASWCSASFISPDGLIMTNHHCSRDVVGALQQDGENFDKQGFYAKTLGDERRAEGLFVEQLNMVTDITEMVMSQVKNPENDAQKNQMIGMAIEKIQAEFSTKQGWEELRLQPVSYYSGGKFSLYGYKRYDDIRLVWIPELDLGLYGGDPDNFTYPRYNLDATFWRAYDEEGNPLNTSEHYFEFNTDGVTEGEVTFVVGNPGNTERYRTVAQLEYDRDYRYPQQLKFMTNRHAIMMEEYWDLMKDPVANEFPAQEKLNEAFGLSNGIKAIGGIVEGLNNDALFGRKVGMENLIKSKSPGINYWDDLQEGYEALQPYAWSISHLGPTPLRGQALLMMFALADYEEMIKGEASEGALDTARAEILTMTETLDTPKERRLFKLLLTEIQEDIYPGDKTLSMVLDGKSIDEYVTNLFDDTRFSNEKKANKCLSKPKKVAKDKDPLLRAARIFVPKYGESVAAFRSSSAMRRTLETKIANQVFNVYGTSLPPDATFTLRISDGVVKGYNYNGTEAPYKTTYYGLYDRHYSNNGEFPWSLPERWLNPPAEFLKTPINYVSTNDIIGGNSGSPMINKDKEVIGLIFDGNIESLPGNFIFDEEYNRTVSVHAGGIYAALKYIFKADRIVDELDGK